MIVLQIQNIDCYDNICTRKIRVRSFNQNISMHLFTLLFARVYHHHRSALISNIFEVSAAYPLPSALLRIVYFFSFFFYLLCSNSIFTYNCFLELLFLK